MVDNFFSGGNWIYLSKVITYFSWFNLLWINILMSYQHYVRMIVHRFFVEKFSGLFLLKNGLKRVGICGIWTHNL